MTNERLRKFYELCQQYRMLPFSDQPMVGQVYNFLVDFVNEEADLRAGEVTKLKEEVSIARERLGPAGYRLLKELGDLRRLVADVAATQTADDAWAQSERCYDYRLTGVLDP